MSSVFMSLHAAGASDYPAPAKMNWLAKLQAFLNVMAIFIQCETHCVSLSVPFENGVWNATNVNQN